ncbi:hypothetical protein DFR34_11384 [Rivihabitans pingtungensis]|uniref:Uncharacterized protein n=2 Tax=Rivihabitans pingtungensis TaxID=1054498 RepID=A0A318KQU0_9NEIS|nr:hypothetical protein DFR34_11384 [Rivihabitans pingtungensis]
MGEILLLFQHVPPVFAMPNQDPISKQLPLKFANGQTIRRFAKHCPACKHIVDSQHMHGVAQLVQDRVVIVAQARCPACGHGFSVTCVVTDDKQVHRVWVPGWALRWWLSRQRDDDAPLRDRDSREWEYEDTPDVPTPLRNPTPSLSAADVTVASEALGQFQGEPIPAWIENQGQRYVFQRASQDGPRTKLGRDEVLYEGRLVYVRDGVHVEV